MNAMKTLKGRLGLDMPNLADMSDDQICLDLVTYQAAIGGNFQVMMMFAYSNARSEIARKVGRDNLMLEVQDEHPRMLECFVQDLGVCLSLERLLNAQDRVTDSVSPLLSLSQWKTTSGHLIMALFENLSLVFIPWMAEAAERLGITDRRYVEVHGEEDIAHALAYIEAFVAEFEHAGLDEEEGIFLTEEMITEGREAKLVMRLLHDIFHAHEHVPSLP